MDELDFTRIGGGFNADELHDLVIAMRTADGSAIDRLDRMLNKFDGVSERIAIARRAVLR